MAALSTGVNHDLCKASLHIPALCKLAQQYRELALLAYCRLMMITILFLPLSQLTDLLGCHSPMFANLNGGHWYFQQVVILVLVFAPWLVHEISDDFGTLRRQDRAHLNLIINILVMGGLLQGQTEALGLLQRPQG